MWLWGWDYFKKKNPQKINKDKIWIWIPTQQFNILGPRSFCFCFSLWNWGSKLVIWCWFNRWNRAPSQVVQKWIPFQLSGFKIGIKWRMPRRNNPHKTNTTRWISSCLPIWHHLEHNLIIAFMKSLIMSYPSIKWLIF